MRSKSKKIASLNTKMEMGHTKQHCKNKTKKSLFKRKGPSIYNIFIFKILVLILSFSNTTQAQTCNTPTSISVAVVSSTCASNGTARLSSSPYSVSAPNNSISREFAIYNNVTLDSLIRPWQNDSLFTNLPPGTYYYALRGICSNGISNTVTRIFTITNGSRVLNLTANITQHSSCNNGVITASASGTAPLSYSLVPALNSPEPLDESEYIRPKQTTTAFYSLAPGVYYLRAYDACGSYVTRQVVVNSVTLPQPISGMIVTKNTCEDYIANFYNHTNFNTAVPGRRYIFTYPDNSKDTSLTYRSSIVINSSKLNLNDSINTVTLRIEMECNNFEISETFNLNTKPSIYLYRTLAGSCDSTNYHFIPSYGTNSYQRAIYKYSTDGGETWHNQTYTSNGETYITLKNSINHTALFALCGDTISIPVYTGSIGLFNATIEEGNARSCNGYSSITFRAFNTNNLSWQLISGPPGASTANTITSSGSTFSWTLNNQPLGIYVIRLYTTCGDELYDTLELKNPHTGLSFDYSFRFECSNNNIELYNYTTNLGGWASRITDMNDNLIRSGSGFTISTISLISGNQYKLQAWPTTYSCTFVEKVFTFTASSSSLDLSNRVSFNECRNTSNDGALIVRPAGGFPPYTYYLYEDTILSANRIIGPVTSNIFTNLNANRKHIVQVSDQCGRGNNISLNFNQAKLQLLDNASGTMPCEGDTLALSLLYQPEFTYQWKKNDINIPGATTNTYTINNIQESDNGVYNLSYNVGACQILTKSFSLAIELCDLSLLPVELVKFTALSNHQSVQLDWSTASEKVNSGFEIYHSTDGYNWQKIGFRPSKSVDGNSSVPLDYSFSHTQALSGINYYQLKQIDLDGMFALSNITQAHLHIQPALIEVYPNPAIGQIQFNGLPSKNKILVTNSLGQTVQTMENVQNQSPVFTKEFSNGTYTISVYTENWELLQNLKLIVL